MSSLNSIRDRRKQYNFLGGRTLAVVLLMAVAAISFTLGYYVGGSGEDGQGVGNATAVIPEGAGLVLLGSGGQSCPEQGGSGGSTDGGFSSGVVLETMKVPSVPEPDERGPEEPVLKPVRSANSDKVNAGSPAVLEVKQETRRVAPARQLPKRTEEAADLASITREARAAATGDEGDDAPGAEDGAMAGRTEQGSSLQAKANDADRRVPQKKKTTSRNPAPAPTDSAAVSVAKSDGRVYSVQVGAFSSLSDAHTHKMRFAKKGYKVSVYKDDNGSGNMYKVRIGAFRSRQGAEDTARKLRDVEGVNAFVTSIE